MYDYFKGILVEITTDAIVIDVSGIGYRVFVPPHHVDPATPLGQELLIYISFVVRETSQILYGFLHREERELFQLLITLSGIGPKTALMLLSHLKPPTIYHAVNVNDVACFSRVPGIGKKGAERLLVDLRTKLKKVSFTVPHTLASDALGALLKLGYPSPKAEKAVKEALQEVPDTKDLSTLVSLALKKT